MKAKLRPTQIHFNTDNGLGSVIVGEQVIRRIVAIAISDISGVKLSSSINSFGLTDLFHKNRQSTAGVHVKMDRQSVRVSVDLVVEYGVGIPGMTRSIQDKIKEAVENMTGLLVESVDIRIVDANILQ